MRRLLADYVTCSPYMYMQFHTQNIASARKFTMCTLHLSNKYSSNMAAVSCIGRINDVAVTCIARKNGPVSTGVPNLGCLHPLGVSDANPNGVRLFSGK